MVEQWIRDLILERDAVINEIGRWKEHGARVVGENLKRGILNHIKDREKKLKSINERLGI